MKIEQTDELLALQKALFFVKFGNDEYDAHYLAVSPILGKLLKQTKEELSKHISKQYGSDMSGGDWGSIEDYPDFLLKVSMHINNVDNWHKFDLVTQQEVIKNLCSPFVVSEITISKLILKTAN